VRWLPHSLYADPEMEGCGQSRGFLWLLYRAVVHWLVDVNLQPWLFEGLPMTVAHGGAFLAEMGEQSSHCGVDKSSRSAIAACESGKERNLRGLSAFVWPFVLCSNVNEGSWGCTMKFIHSSDLQIGKAFGYFEPETATILQDARQAVVRTLGEAAVESGATAILIAGDIYEKQQMAQPTLVKPIENMRSFANVQWHLMPGNHDHFRENGLWDRLTRMQLPSNVRLHIRPGAVQMADDGDRPLFLLPAPLHHTTSSDDLSVYMDQEATPEGAIPIRMAA
jgi:Calcineurin-like phosphoesterase